MMHIGLQNFSLQACVWRHHIIRGAHGVLALRIDQHLRVLIILLKAV